MEPSKNLSRPSELKYGIANTRHPCRFSWSQHSTVAAFCLAFVQGKRPSHDPKKVLGANLGFPEIPKLIPSKLAGEPGSSELRMKGFPNQLITSNTLLHVFDICWFYPVFGEYKQCVTMGLPLNHHCKILLYKLTYIVLINHQNFAGTLSVLIVRRVICRPAKNGCHVPSILFNLSREKQ